MKQRNPERRSLDPRTGLLLLVLANVIAFTQDSFWVEGGLIAVLTLLQLLCGCIRPGIKWCALFCLLLALQWYVLPMSPKLVATSFSIFINYARRMFPCLMMGSLMVRTISLRRFIVGMRALRVPQKLIIPISVTLRYFPAIKEELSYIRDAMRLRDIRGLEKVEGMVVPMMISATETAEELSAAAVTRGIENPARKTSVIRLRLGLLDWCAMAAAVVFTGAALLA